MRILILLGILYGVYYFFYGGHAYQAMSYQPTLPAPVSDQNMMLKEPVQKNLSGMSGVGFGMGRLKFMAEYEITARVLSKKNYIGDSNSRISPTDLALGWGRMSDPSVIRQLSITQGGRFYNYHWSGHSPIPGSEIVTSSANVHIVPANSDVRAAIDRLRQGQVVTLKGYLVNYREESGNSWWAWNTSMTRSDSGNGACELMYVEYVIGY